MQISLKFGERPRIFFNFFSLLNSKMCQLKNISLFITEKKKLTAAIATLNFQFYEHSQYINI